MKVFHLVQRYPPAIGGSENWCRSLCEYAVSEGVISKVATINLYDIEEFFKELPPERQLFKLGEEDHENGVFVKRYKLWSFADRGFGAFLVRFLLYKLQLHRTQVGGIFKHSPHSFEMYRRIAKDIKDSDIVHLHTVPYFHNLIGFLYAKWFKKKIVITPHFHPGHVHYERRLFYKMMDRCDAVIAMTPFEKDYLVQKGVREEKIHISGNSIDSTPAVDEADFRVLRERLFREHRISENAKKIIFIGRKEENKGIRVLIEATEVLARELKDEIVLFLVGPMIAAFDDYRKGRLPQERLKIIDLGSVPDEVKEALLKCSDVLVLHSAFEAFGIVFLEAWKYSKPVIGSDRGAIPSVIRGAGLWAEYGNVRQLAQKIREVLEDPGLAADLGENGRKKLETEYSTAIINQKTLNVYSRLYGAGKKVLIVNNLFPPHTSGGAEIVAYHQAKALEQLGFKVCVFCGERGHRMPRYTVTRKKKPFNIHRIHLDGQDFDCEQIRFEKKDVEAAFTKVLYEEAPDLVHFHNLYGLSVRMIGACKAAHIPAVVTLHDYWLMCFRSILIGEDLSICSKKETACCACKLALREADPFLRDLGERNAVFLQELNLADRIISPSQYLIQRFIDCGLDRDKTCVINNGIDMARFKGAEKTASAKIRFTYLGQIIEHKGIETLLAALPLLDEAERKKISVSVIGKGEAEFVLYCQKLAQEWGISDLVNFEGWVRNSRVPGIFRRTDVLVVPSVWPENSPVTIMEALASGTPVIASRVGGIPELVEEGVHGLLFEYRDASALADKILEFIRHPERIQKMGPACIEKARQYDLSKQVSILAGHYRDLIERHWDT